MTFSNRRKVSNYFSEDNVLGYFKNTNNPAVTHFSNVTNVNICLMTSNTHIPYHHACLPLVGVVL